MNRLVWLPDGKEPILRFLRKAWDRRLLDLFRVGDHEGIQLCDLSKEASRRDRFIAATVEALDLIKSTDPRRFRRVQRHISYIRNVEISSIASYRHDLDVCNVNFSYFLPNTWETQMSLYRGWEYRIEYAQTLVHEATHGAILARGVRGKRLSSSTRIRIEQLCFLEERRFVERNWEGLANYTAGFDERDYLKDGPRPSGRIKELILWLSRTPRQREFRKYACQRALDGVDLRRARLAGIHLVGANLRAAKLKEADLRNADLYGADLSGADLEGANLSGADLGLANLFEANLSRAHLTGAQLARSMLAGANLRGTDLRSTRLRFARLDDATYDHRTQWPPAFDPQARGAKRLD